MIDDVLVVSPTKWGAFPDNRQFNRQSGLSFKPKDRKTLKVPQYTLSGLSYINEPNDCNCKIKVTNGRVYYVALDIRPTSKTYGKYMSCVLDDKMKHVMYTPKGFARGFYAFSDATIVTEYDEVVNEENFGGIAYDDSDLRIKWTNTSFYFPPQAFLKVDEACKGYPTFKEYKKNHKTENND